MALLPSLVLGRRAPQHADTVPHFVFDETARSCQLKS
eukprot:CAMPEP_0182524018 /NCGR_PEP_ID=MMETSP1323-20130603/1501_1 /TAXON_ID=236787 /ORGANISM="Florenciella parvula, Strain RCC1693" /LENGTH=36 /DNA_ID= /DNA_START= /DNA_END= /DNA_ORIENTATION=